MATWVVVESTDEVLRVAPNRTSAVEQLAADERPERVELQTLAGDTIGVYQRVDE